MSNKFYFTGDHFGSEVSGEEVRDAIVNVSDTEYGFGRDIFRDEIVTNVHGVYDFENCGEDKVHFNEQDYQKARDDAYEKIIAELCK